MSTSAEFEIVRQMKEQCCYVAFNPQKEEESKNFQQRRYQLPDGSVVDLGAEAFRAPEILFQPDLIGSESRGNVVLFAMLLFVQPFNCDIIQEFMIVW